MGVAPARVGGPRLGERKVGAARRWRSLGNGTAEVRLSSSWRARIGMKTITLERPPAPAWAALKSAARAESGMQISPSSAEKIIDRLWAALFALGPT